jgi:hypothetical protein
MGANKFRIKGLNPTLPLMSQKSANFLNGRLDALKILWHDLCSTREYFSRAMVLAEAWGI